MTFGVKILDAGGHLVASHAAKTLHYAGAALYNRSSGYYLHYYRIQSSAQVVLPFVEVPVGSTCSFNVMTVIKISSSVWEICLEVNSGPSWDHHPTLNPASDIAPTELIVHCFIDAAVMPNGTHGLRVFNQGGEVGFDSTQKPLMVSSSVLMAGDQRIEQNNGYFNFGGGSVITSAQMPTSGQRLAWFFNVRGRQLSDYYTSLTGLRVRSGVVDRYMFLFKWNGNTDADGNIPNGGFTGGFSAGRVLSVDMSVFF